jgi:hypothetical protein
LIATPIRRGRSKEREREGREVGAEKEGEV